MTTVPTPQQLAQIEDEHLEELAHSWRAQAGRGDREAFGVAHALEVELRRRVRTSQLQQLPESPAPPPRPWWKFWGSDSADSSNASGRSGSRGS